MKMIFLGTSASTPSPSRYAPSIVICTSEYCIMLDCGEGAQIRLQEAGLDVLRLGYIIITHLHGDHVYGLMPIIDSYIMKILSQKIKGKTLHIYAPKNLCQYLGQLPSDIIKCYGVEPKDVSNSIDIGRIKLNLLPMMHGDIEAYGVYLVIKDKRNNRINLFYSGDGVSTKETLQFLKSEKPCIVIHDATFLDYYDDAAKAKEKFHATVADAARLASEVNAKILILTHMSNRYRETDLREFVSRAHRIFYGDIFLAYDLATIWLDKVSCS